MARSRQLKGIFAGVVIVLCIVFVVWRSWPKPAPYIAPADNPAAKWMRGYGETSLQHASNSGDAFYWATANITIEPTADGQGVTVRGKVKTPAELDLIKSELGKIQPTVPIDWQVGIGR
jgi:hypothetical protein